MNEGPLRACLWLGRSNDPRGQDPQLERADLERVCQQRGWPIVKTYEVEESDVDKTPGQQFQAMLEDARKGEFEVVATWSFDDFGQERNWSVSRIIATMLAWGIRLYSYQEPFLDTTGPFVESLIALFAWLERRDKVRKGKAVRLGIEKAKAKGKVIGRPMVVNKLDGRLVVQLRAEGKSWREIAQVHPPVTSASGKQFRPSVGSIRRAFATCNRPTTPKSLLTEGG